MNIDTDEDFPEHPKTVRFCALLGNPVGWAYIWKLWRFCKKYRPNGDLTGFSPNEIELAVGWAAMDGKLFNAAVKSGFIDHDKNGTRVHHWMHRMGASIIRVDIDRLRKAADRAKRAGDPVEAKRLDDTVAALRGRLSVDGTRTSDGRPSDVHHLSDGQVPNGVGPVTDFHGSSGVSALLCSALYSLQGETPSRDPTDGATEHGPATAVVPSTAPTTVAAQGPKTGRDAQELFARVRSEMLPGCLPWEIPPDTRGKIAQFIAGLSPEARADAEPTMRLLWRHVLAGDKDWDDAGYGNVSFAYGSWSSRLTQLREELHGVVLAAKPKARPGEIRYDEIT